MTSPAKIIAAYAELQHAETHARTISGVVVESIEVSTKMPISVLDDINSDDWEDADTPVIATSDILVTQPSTPRAKAKSKPPEDE